MIQPTIRKAIASDLDILLKFEQGVIAAERPFDPTLKKDPIRYYDIEGMMKDENVSLVVAENENGVIASGYARIESSKPYLQHGKHAYLGFMYVHPDHRGKGVNGIILQALKEWAVSKGITELRLDVYYPNEAAIRAYEKMGFKKHMIEMRMGM